MNRLLTLLLATALAACSKKPAPPPMGAAPVTVAHPISREVAEWNEFTGRTEAVESVEIRARVSGYLQEIHFKPGATVNKGDLLFVIDPRPYQADYDRAAAEVTRAEAQQKWAATDFDRAKQLRENKIASAEEFDSKATQFTTATAAVAAAKAALESSKLNLEFTQIRSPITGRVSSERHSVGNLIQPSPNADGILTTVVALDPIYAVFDADENSILQYMKMTEESKRPSASERHLPIFIGLQNEEGWPHEGYIDFVDNRLDPNTGTQRIRGVFKSWDSLVTPGFFARIRVPIGQKAPALLVPERAIQHDQAETFVWVVDAQNIPQMRPIKPGPSEGALRVVRSGLQLEDKVVVNGLQRIRPGAPVDPQMEVPAPTPEAK